MFVVLVLACEGGEGWGSGGLRWWCSGEEVGEVWMDLGLSRGGNFGRSGVGLLLRILGVRG